MLHHKAGVIIIALFIIISLFSPVVLGQRRRTRQSREQLSFGSEIPIVHRVIIPQAVLNQLADFEGGQLRRCQQSESSRKPTMADHFAASPMNINNDGQTDLVVQAQTLCFMGAHSTVFWIFAKFEPRLYPRYDMVFSERADYLGIRKPSSSGYRDIETASHTATELYTIVWKFDGQKYQRRLCSTEDLSTHKVVRVRCSNFQ